MEAADFNDLKTALIQHWGIAPQVAESDPWEALRAALARRVATLLEHDYEKLLYSMYAIDIPEDRFAKAVDLNEPERSARAIAKLILDREIEKMESRKRYANSQDPNDAPRIEDQPE